MLRIGLLGFTLENANKGCEALTYSFLYTLQRLFGKKIAVRYYSTVELYGNIRNYFPDIQFSYYQLSRKHMLWGVRGDFEKNCDLLFDISFGDGFADIYDSKLVFWNTLVKQKAGLSRIPFILLPQTYGPFQNCLLERQAAYAVKRASAVFSRDELSSEYVKKISKQETITVTDLAFALPYTAVEFENNGKLKLGINISGLLWRGGFHKENQFGLKVDYQRYIRGLLEYYSKQTQYEIHLVPHVVETVDKSNDGDLYINELLAKEYPDVVKAPAFADPVETKNYIAGLDIVTAARMHATIDAFSANVPVVPFSYSRKFDGLYGSLGYHYIVDGCQLETGVALEKTIRWINEYSVLQQAEADCMKQIQKKNQKFYEEMQKYM